MPHHDYYPDDFDPRPPTRPLAHLALAVLTIVCLLGIAALIGVAVVDGVS